MHSATASSFFENPFDTSRTRHRPATTSSAPPSTTDDHRYPLYLLQPTAQSPTSHSALLCMNNGEPSAARQSIFHPSPFQHHSYAGNASEWPSSRTSMGGPAASTQHGLKRTRQHQRTPSASTINSTGPSSPYGHSLSYPTIANTDFTPAQFADYSKPLTPSHTPNPPNFLAAGYLPIQPSQTSSAHQAMKAFAIDYHIDDFIPDYTIPSRQQMSSRENESPATPQSGAGDTADAAQYNMGNNDYGRSGNPNVQLFRTESQAYQDELYNPSLPPPSTSTPSSKPAAHYLSPHTSLMTQRLQTANIARAQSPQTSAAVQRERSPFRDGSEFAANGFSRSQNGVGTAASMRQQQKEQAEQAEYAQHRPKLNREPTKTISPKDAMLDYNDQDQTPLFQDNVPTGYKQLTGGTEQWPQGFSFGNLQMQPAQAQMPVNFRAASGDGMTGTDAYSYLNLPQQQMSQAAVPNVSYPAASYARAKTSSYPMSDPTPAFPANLTSMESSTGSQDEDNTPHVTPVIQRPADTRANTGTYTCTYHGCTQRFDSLANLQRHKRDSHRSQQTTPREATSNDSVTAASSGSASDSARSSMSPDPSTAGMTSAAIMARNSQAGPHKCTRINLSTNKPCNVVFSRPYDLTRHEDTIHNGRKQKVRCPMCREEKTFSRNDALTRHMRVVHPEAEAFGKRGRRD